MTEKPARAVTIKQAEIDPMPLEVLADAIKSISDGIKMLRYTRLNDKALYLLIQHAAPKIAVGKYGSKAAPSVREIQAVLEGIENLEREYLKPARRQ